MEYARKSGRGFLDDEEYSRREGSAPRVVPDDDQKQRNKMRSRHSATEQRRRSKINDGFQILQDFLPHNDQKRDKASLLLEVIEYIKFLQEKVLKYETYPGWNQENTKLIPWKLSDVSKNSPSVAEYMFSGKFDDNGILVSPTNNAGLSYKVVETSGFSTKEPSMSVSMQTNLYDNMASQCQSDWIRTSCPTDCTTNEQEELIIDEGTLRVSAVYSQELFATLTQSLQSSGVDLSRASISVQINLGKRAINRHVAATTIPNAKDHGDPSSSARAMGHSSAGNSDEDSEHAQKRRKSDVSS